MRNRGASASNSKNHRCQYRLSRPQTVGYPLHEPVVRARVWKWKQGVGVGSADCSLANIRACWKSVEVDVIAPNARAASLNGLLDFDARVMDRAARQPGNYFGRPKLRASSH